MRSVSLILAIVLFLLGCVTTPVSAVVVKSEFNAGDGGDGRDGWVHNLPDDGYTGPSERWGDPESTVVWDPLNGGCLKSTDIAVSCGDVFVAPAKFLGNRLSNEYLSFDYKRDNPIVIPNQPFPLVRIYSDNDLWAFCTNIEANTDWQHFKVYLDGGPGWLHCAGSKSWTEMLGNITEFTITGDLIINSNYGLAYEVNYLDNVVLVPEPATLLLLGLGGLTLLRKRGA